jgi:hypothetical protein
MPIVKNLGDKCLILRFLWQSPDEAVIIEPKSEVSIPDDLAQIFLGYLLESKEQKMMCVERLRTIGNDVNLDYLLENIKIEENVTLKRDISRRKTE